MSENEKTQVGDIDRSMYDFRYEETEDFYSVAGRVMAIRNTGMFIDLMDTTGKIQIFSHYIKNITYLCNAESIVYSLVLATYFDTPSQHVGIQRIRCNSMTPRIAYKHLISNF